MLFMTNDAHIVILPNLSFKQIIKCWKLVLEESPGIG